MDAQTQKLVRDFRRHFHKVEQAYAALAKGGSFSFRLEYKDGQALAQNETPDPAETVRFVVLMRRFLSPTDTLYCRKLLDSFSPDLTTRLSQTRVDSLLQGIHQLRQGTFPITVNGESLTAEKIYETLSTGEYFGDDAAAQAYLAELRAVPLAGPLLWYSFYEYTLAGFALMSAMFQTLKDARFLETGVGSSDSTPISIRNQCIYCLSADGGSFTAEEHVFPESLGNDEIVLPPGYVCDACNNGILSELDNALLEFDPIAWLRVWLVPYNKKGKLPTANFQNMSLKRTAPRHIQMIPKDKTGRVRNLSQIDDERVAFSLQMRGKRLNPRLLGRALYKIALGLVALDLGQELACSSKYDGARRFIMGDQGSPGGLLMRMKVDMHPAVRATHDPALPGTIFAFDIFGVMFVLNLEAAPTLQVPKELEALDFVLLPMDHPSRSHKHRSNHDA